MTRQEIAAYCQRSENPGRTSRPSHPSGWRTAAVPGRTPRSQPGDASQGYDESISALSPAAFYAAHIADVVGKFLEDRQAEAKAGAAEPVNAAANETELKNLDTSVPVAEEPLDCGSSPAPAQTAAETSPAVIPAQ